MIGQAETLEFLEPKPVRLIWGIGEAGQAALAAVGIHSIGDLRRWDRKDLGRRFGTMGERLWHLARGQDDRHVTARDPVKGISNETTFHEDTADRDLLDGHLWRMADKVAGRAKAQGIAGRVVGLKLKRANHTLVSRRQALHQPTQMADTVYRVARNLLDQVTDPGPFRLLGVALTDLVDGVHADREADLLDPGAGNRARAERATDAIRARFGEDAIVKGRALR